MLNVNLYLNVVHLRLSSNFASFILLVIYPFVCFASWFKLYLTEACFGMARSSIDVSGPAVFHFDYEISSPSSVVPKLLDKLVHSALNFKADVTDVLTSIFEADPDCFAGQLLLSAFELLEHFSEVQIDRCHTIADKLGSRVTDWESRWYNAVYTYKLTSARQGCHILMDLLAEYPFDLLAVYIGMFWAFYSVDKFLMRDIIGRVLPFHAASHPYRMLLESFYGFALMETCSIEKGSRMVDAAFQFDSRNPWMIHAECHSLEYCGRSEDALAMLIDERASYKGSALEFHNTWHLAFFQAGWFSPLSTVIYSNL